MMKTVTRAARPGHQLAAFLAFTALGLLALAAGVVRIWNGPILFCLDPGVYHFTSVYFAENTTFWPLPWLDLTTDWSLYPHGLSHVFLHWAFERDLFVLWLKALWNGPGPWLQIYFLLSSAVTAVGVYLVLVRETSPLRAALVGWVASFFNFYTIAKFPLHQPYTATHWTVIGIAIDYVLLRRHDPGKPFRSPELLLLRVAVALLGFGLELGYVAGFGLTSFLLTMAWIGATAVVFRFHSRWATRREVTTAALPAPGARPRALAALVIAIAAAAWLYLPLVAAVAAEARRFDFKGIPAFSLSASPKRLLIPVLPGLDPYDGAARLARWFDDRPESWSFDFAPGFGLVALAFWGLVASGRQALRLTPLLLLTALLLSFDPIRFPLLRVLPWFAFARVSGRVTIVLPLLFALFALRLPPIDRLRSWGRILLVGIFACFAAEATTAYSRILRARDLFPGTAPSADLLALGRLVHETPGEALFEWPFVLAPSNSNLGAYYGRLGGARQLAMLHGKKGLGLYMGRMHPSEVARAERLHWGELILPDGASSPRQRRDFTPSEWEFLERFLGRHDFAGVLLFTDLLRPETVSGFEERFGRVVARADFLEATGPVAFIPSTPRWKERAGPPEMAAEELERTIFELVPPSCLDLSTPASDDYLFGGWNFPASSPRYMEDDRAEIRFRVTSPSGLRLRLKTAAWGSQRLRVYLNGKQLAEIRPPPSAAAFEWPIPDGLWREQNSLLFAAPDAQPALSSRGAVRVGPSIDWIELLDPTSPGCDPELLFRDGFEHGDAGRWSVHLGGFGG